MRLATIDLLRAAYGRHAVGAFNVSNLEQVHGLFRGVAVEAELGQLKGIEDAMSHDVKEAILTDPAKAGEFVERTGCDSLAVAIGTSHGAYPSLRRHC